MSINFQYDAFGNRVMKNVSSTAMTQNSSTYYVRDGQGNVLSVYTYKVPSTGGAQKLYWSEAGIYGSSRLGLYTPEIEMNTAVVATTDVYLNANRGYKQYELSNHLGNVLATISDRKLAVTGNPGITYTADLIRGQDYYAFGAKMPGRSFTAGTGYRFGFNGKENDNEVKGDGNQQDYGFRIYDPRLGKFLSVDPLTKKYPELTAYQFASNTPIQAIDLDGAEKKVQTVVTIQAPKNGDEAPLPQAIESVKKNISVQLKSKPFSEKKDGVVTTVFQDPQKKGQVINRVLYKEEQEKIQNAQQFFSAPNPNVHILTETELQIQSAAEGCGWCESYLKAKEDIQSNEGKPLIIGSILFTFILESGTGFVKPEGPGMQKEYNPVKQNTKRGLIHIPIVSYLPISPVVDKNSSE